MYSDEEFSESDSDDEVHSEGALGDVEFTGGMFVQVDAVFGTLARCSQAIIDRSIEEEVDENNDFQIALKFVDSCINGIKICCEEISRNVFNKLRQQGNGMLFEKLFRISKKGDGTNLKSGEMQKLLDHVTIALATAESELCSFSCEQLICASANQLASNYIACLSAETQSRNFWNKLRFTPKNISHLKFSLESDDFADAISMRKTSGVDGENDAEEGHRTILRDWDLASHDLVRLCLEAADDNHVSPPKTDEERRRRASSRKCAAPEVIARLKRLILPHLALFYDLISFLAVPANAFGNVVGNNMDATSRPEAVARLAFLALELRVDLEKKVKNSLKESTEALMRHRMNKQNSIRWYDDVYRNLF
eukprot:g2710.t1